MRSRTMRRVAARYFWDRTKVSLWFVPALMALGAFVLSRLLGNLDERIPNELLSNSKFIFTASAVEMRAAMIGFAGTILATTGVVFSLLTLPLSTVAAQFGSRLLRLFMRDRTTQYVLGTFVGTFCYCLSTALTIPLSASQEDLPQITVTFGIILSVASFASLIVLIQHISIMLQAPNIAAAAGRELLDAIEIDISGEPAGTTKAIEDQAASALAGHPAYPLQVDRVGYVQYIDPEIILNLAAEKDLVIRLLRKPGQFVRRGETVALVWKAAEVDVEIGEYLRRAVQIGNQRTPMQDIEYAINQLVEVAVRAMSPAINDPFTAITCLDYLSNGLGVYVQYDEISPNLYDRNGRLRLIFEPLTQVQLFAAAFDMLRHASCDNATVLLHLLDAIESIGQAAKLPEARQELARHAHLVQVESCAGALVEADKQRINLRAENVGRMLTQAEPA